MRRKTFRPGLIGISLLACMAAQPAAAQNAPAPAAPAPAVEEPDAATIVVTGSRIARLRADAVAPTQVTTGSALERSGDVLLQENFKRSPAFSFTTPGASSPVGLQRGFTSGQTFIDYLGLGSQRTLVLIDSQRSVSSASASVFTAGGPGSQVDINTIPTLMVDRIETVSIGGAPIYGADAIAGTVNLVLKDRFHGVKLDGEAGVSGHGDAAQYRLGAIAGTDFADGRGSIIAAFEYTDSDGLLGSDRAVVRDAPGYNPSTTPWTYVPNLRRTDFTDYGIPLASNLFFPGFSLPNGANFDIHNSQGQVLSFNAAGQLAPFVSNGVIFSAGGDGFNASNVTSLLTPLRRYAGYAKGHYELSNSVTLRLAGSYSRTEGTTLRGDPAYNGNATLLGSANAYLPIPLTNAFLTAADRATIQASLPKGATTFYLARANTDVITGRATSTTDVFRISGGLDGDFAVAGRDWHWEATTSWGRSVNLGRGRGLLEQNFQNALGSIQVNPVTFTYSPCTRASSPIASINPTCSPFNPFGQNNSQAVLDYVTAAYTARAVNTQWVATATARGSLFDLSGGPAGVVVGLEHRYEHSQFDPDAYLYGQPGATPTSRRTSYGRGAPIDPVRGHYHTTELFGELRLPLADPFEVNGAGRYVDNSITGGAFTWTAGAKFRPIPDVTLRGNFTHSIRSPSVTELFNPVSQSFLSGTDPCGSSVLAQNLGPNPAVRAANCAAAGVPAVKFNSNISNVNGVLGTFTGNPKLRNEVADSWTLGLVLTPQALPGLSVSIDWLDIRLKDAIIGETARQVLEACYDSPTYPAPAECSQFTRSTATGQVGQVTTINTGYVNASSTRYSGLTVDGSWQIAAPFFGPDGRVTLDAQYQYTDRLETQVRDVAITHLAGSVGYSKHKATGTLALDNAVVGGWVRMNYIGPAVLDVDAPTLYDTPHRGAVAFIDAGAHFTVQDRFTLRMSVENVFDTKPPFPAPAGGGIIAYWQGVMGRYFKVGASAAF